MSAKQQHLLIEDYLDHIEEAAPLCSIVAGMTKEAFLEDRKTQQAVIYNIFIIGEAASQIINDHPNFIVTHPDIPWREMRGMRNRLAHGYFGLDQSIIWDTVTTYLVKLSQQIATLK